jgi:AAT family amino acid transporter
LSPTTNTKTPVGFHVAAADKPVLLRTLQNRHIQFIALGGAIGSGLFYGSASTIGLAGPSVLLGYVIGGGIMFIIMRALGEMAVDEPISGSFSAYANRYIGPFAGFSVGWTYWFSWIVVDMAELTAFGVYVSYWFPGLPTWISGLGALVVIVSINITSVRSFGEAEFWFALVKVVAILALMAAGAAILFFHLGSGASVSNLWDYGGLFPKGVSGLFLALPLVMFSFGGTELIGITAGEARNPDKSIPRAINQVSVRILLFYVGAILFILMLVPWTKVGLGASPFVTAFSDVGIPNAAALLNFVVITAALSAFNSGMYSTGRMLLTLAQNGQAPTVFEKISARGHVPFVGILFSGMVLLIGVVLNLLLPRDVFLYLSSIATIALIFNWTMILLTQWHFRRTKMKAGRASRLRFPLFAWPYTTYLGLGGMALVVAMMAFQPTTRIALVVGPIWFATLAFGYYIMRRRSSAAADSGPMR